MRELLNHRRPQMPRIARGCRIPAHYIPTPQFPRFPKNVDFRPKLRTGFSMVVFAIFAERPYPQKFSKFVFDHFSRIFRILRPPSPYVYNFKIPKFYKCLSIYPHPHNPQSVPVHIILVMLGYANRC